MALKVSREEFVGAGSVGIPSPEVVAAKMILDFEISLLRRMDSLGIRQKDLAERLGVTSATVSKTLSETSNMTFKTAARLANALGCTLDAPVLRALDEKPYGGYAYATHPGRTAQASSTADSASILADEKTGWRMAA